MSEFTPVDEHPDVEAAKAAVREKQADVRNKTNELEQLREDLEDRNDHLLDVEAQQSIGDATAEDVQAAERAVQSVKDEIQRLERELRPAERALKLLNDKLREAKEAARDELQVQVNQEYGAAVDDLIGALKDAEQARQRMSEIRAVFLNRHNGLSKPPLSQPIHSVGAEIGGKGNYKPFDAIQKRA